VITVDLREELRGALDELEPLLVGRVVDIEMARLWVLVDPAAFRSEVVALVADAVADTDPNRVVTVRVARAGSSVRIDVVRDADGSGDDDVVGTIRVPLAPGSTSAAPG
jgi:hypothetical protein